ncbi:hypothetical protein C8R45DRAFT_958192 [Mycena sanguinolenta]|nr:hypothetical protein C8R45DRAFT_958192 [Mycena sanguinolenta]
MRVLKLSSKCALSLISSGRMRSAFLLSCFPFSPPPFHGTHATHSDGLYARTAPIICLIFLVLSLRFGRFDLILLAISWNLFAAPPRCSHSSAARPVLSCRTISRSGLPPDHSLPALPPCRSPPCRSPPVTPSVTSSGLSCSGVEDSRLTTVPIHAATDHMDCIETIQCKTAPLGAQLIPQCTVRINKIHQNGLALLRPGH